MSEKNTFHKFAIKVGKKVSGIVLKIISLNFILILIVKNAERSGIIFQSKF